MEKTVFKRPTLRQTRIALGKLPVLSRSYFDLTSTTCFSRIPKVPKIGSWLDIHEENGQTHDEFLSFYNTIFYEEKNLNLSGRTITLFPLGSFENGIRIPKLDILKEYVEIFFPEMKCRVSQQHSINDVQKVWKIRSRKNSSGPCLQLLTTDVMTWVDQIVREDDDFLAMCVTFPYDLYPCEKWNFVFGEAKQFDRVCVQSLCRYDPDFPYIKLKNKRGQKKKVAAKIVKLVLQRCLSTLTHELLHLLGFDHCIYFRCLMNGSNTMEESDGSTLFLCPVCLNKLKRVLDFDPKVRYLKLRRYFARNLLLENCSWIDKRIEEVENQKSSKKRNVEDGKKESKKRRKKKK